MLAVTNCAGDYRPYTSQVNVHYADGLFTRNYAGTVQTSTDGLTWTGTPVFGALTLASGAGSQALAGGYTSVPKIICSDSTAQAAVKCFITLSGTTATVNAIGTGSDVISYIVGGRNQ